MGILSDATLDKAKKEIKIKDDSIRGDFLNSLKDEIKQDEPEIDERLDIEVNYNDVSINGKEVQNVTSDDLNTMKNEAKSESTENGKTQTENLNDRLKSYSFGDFLEKAFDEWLENLENYVTFLKEHGHEYDSILSATIDYALTRYSMQNYKEYVADQMSPNINIENIEFPFDSREEILEAIEKYLEKHPDSNNAEALDKILEYHARHAVGMDELFKEIYAYKKENDIETFKEARHEVMAEKIFKHTGLDKILDYVSDNYEDYTIEGEDFDFDSAFQAACIMYKDELKSDYVSVTEYIDNMKEIYNDVDRVSDKIWRTLNEEKNKVVDYWREQAYDLLSNQ